MEIYLSVSWTQIIETRNLGIFSANALALSYFILYTHTQTHKTYMCVCIHGLPLDCKEIKPVNPKENQSWIFIGRTKAEAETLILWPPDAKNWLIGKDPDAGKTEGRSRRGWHGWIASPTQQTCVWASSGSWWWTGKPGVLQSMGLQRVGHDWATELNWWASLVAQTVKHLPTTQETRIRSLAWKDPLGKEMAIHSSILA